MTAQSDVYTNSPAPVDWSAGRGSRCSHDAGRTGKHLIAVDRQPELVCLHYQDIPHKMQAADVQIVWDPMSV